MPILDKQALSQFIRTDCFRRLRLDLSPDHGAFEQERMDQGMPPVQPPRPGLEHLAQAGEEWQAEKVADLAETFGPDSVLGDSELDPNGRLHFRRAPLGPLLQDLAADRFLAEAQFEVTDEFLAAVGIQDYGTRYALQYSQLRPDLIQVLAPLTNEKIVLPSGATDWLPAGDQRPQLRIIDIKLTAEPSPAYFAEVTYYSMALAGWLETHGMDDRYVVVPDAAVWPGSHDASTLIHTYRDIQAAGRTATFDELRTALDSDLEHVPFEVFSGRIRHFLTSDIPIALEGDWGDLPWHVDNRCKGCDYLGFPWLDRNGNSTSRPLHCMPTAESSAHLSRVAFISRGASAALRSAGVDDVQSLAQLQPDSVHFDGHFSLRATRTVVAGRADSLQTQAATIAPNSGTTAAMPRWADLRIYLTIDFDLGSAITFGMGVAGFWLEPQAFGATGARQHEAYQAQTFVIDHKDLHAERRELLAFLARIRHILEDARTRSAGTTVQFYIWDQVQYKHLTRIIGRHLPYILAQQPISHLAWLFPPEELLPNPPSNPRRSPVTIVKEVVRSLLAVPIPHYYTLFQTVRHFHTPGDANAMSSLSVHPLFEDPLSDQIPSERAHEIWARVTHPHPWADQLAVLRETVGKQLRAIEAVTKRLEQDLRASLTQTAPPINIGPPQRQVGISFDGQLWYGFAKLNAAIDELDVHQVRAMPPHEREARFRSARLGRRLLGTEEQAALTSFALPPQQNRRVYTVRPASCEAKMREDDFTFAISPENDAGFLDRSFASVTNGTRIHPNTTGQQQAWRWRMERVMGVTIRALDRDSGLMVIDGKDQNGITLDVLEQLGIVDLSADAILDPVSIDTFTKKLRDVLHAIGNPPSARENALVRRAVGLQARRRPRVTAECPASEFLWLAGATATQAANRNLPPVRTQLEATGITLNPYQWAAWERALTGRLTLVWGPPGTGKSRTLWTIIVGAVLEAIQNDRPLRILICAPTYNALDNVLLDAHRHLPPLVPDGASVTVSRMRSVYRSADSHVPADIDLLLNRYQPSPEVLALRQELEQQNGINVVAATPEQTFNFLAAGDASPQQPLFDLVVLDEASQLDVAHAILPLAAVAANGSLVVAGDPKQLPPIHQAKAPEGLEGMVGSVYEFFESAHNVAPVILQENYRSNSAIIEFAHQAGYDRALTSHSPDMAIQFADPVPDAAAPADWPADLHWTPEWAALLNPGQPISTFVYSEGRSSQWNRFEADAVAALVYLLHNRLSQGLLNEIDPVTGVAMAGDAAPYADQDFWDRGVGIVTPHRAQQALIVARLRHVFAVRQCDSTLIRDAVDTVERFQGRQRDVIIASYALGDNDAIRDEDEFLMSLNRFNVMVSRARAKMILLVTQEVVNHLADDLDVLRESRLLKTFAETFCDQTRPMTLGHITDAGVQHVEGVFKQH